MRTLLILSRYGHLGASSRVRLFQYIPELEKRGFRITTRPLFDDDYLQTLYGHGKRRVADLVRSYGQRLYRVMQARQHDLLWIEKELLPFVPGVIESHLLPRVLPYVLDYDDATFHRYDQHAMPLVRKLYAHKLEPLIAASAAVTAGNAYLADYALKAGAGCIYQIPTVVDVSRYPVYSMAVEKELRIGWIGSPSTTPYLEMLKQPLEMLAREHRVRLVTIGAGTLPKIRVASEQHAWTEATESDLLAGCHVGIMPLPDALWERGKCGYKLIQCMACGLPVVASPVGANVQIVTPEVGYLASSCDQWLEALGGLAQDRGLRQKLGRAGRRAVEAQYSLHTQAPRVADILLRAAGHETMPS